MVTESPALTEIFVVQSARTVLEKEVRDKMKKLNAMKHTTQTQSQRLDDLKPQYQSMKPQNRSPLLDTQKQEEEEKVEIVLFFSNISGVVECEICVCISVIMTSL